MQQSLISIVIPLFNEEKTVTRLIDHLVVAANDLSSMEILFVDGGSTDMTTAVVTEVLADQKTSNIRLISSGKGRALQLATGADHATGDILYFLHVDSFPPQDFDLLIREAIAAGHPAGCFRMKFDSHHPWLMFIASFTRFNWRASRGGDQSQYITRDLYDQIGGYDRHLPIYEDYQLIHKLYDSGKFHVIQKSLITSSRRYKEHGVLRLQALYLRIYWMRYRGATITEIHRFYLNYCQKNAGAKQAGQIPAE